MQFKILYSLTKRLPLACALLLAMSIAAPAYTVVLRSGERIQIPDQFTLTGTTLTYEIAPSINRTILLNTIDIAATERANNEIVGGLLQRISTTAAGDKPREAGTLKTGIAVSVGNQTPSQPSQTVRPTLTNQNIEAARRRNQARGQAYELQRRNLPPVSEEEQKRRADEQLRFMQEFDARRAEQLGGTEETFRTQAQTLRLELAEVNTELSYYRARLAEAARPSSLTSLATSSTTIAGIPPFAYPYSFGGIVPGISPVFGTGAVGALHGWRRGTNLPDTRRSTSFGVGVSIGGGLRGGVAIGGRYVRRDVGNQRVRQRDSFFYGYPYSIGVPFVGYPSISDDVAQIRDRVRDLEATRQRLFARHRALEEEARRTGVAPGVLR